MTQEEFRTSMIRILSFHRAPKTPAETADVQNYMASLFEAVHPMDGYTFDRVTKELAKNMSRGQKPMPAQFWAVYYKFKGDQNAQRVDLCDSCKSTYWVYVHMVHAESGREGDFAIPCPKCQVRHPLKDAMPRLGWTMQDLPARSHKAQLLEMAEKLGPNGANYVLALMEKFKVNFSEDVVLKLIERADGAPRVAPTGPAVEVLESLKVEPTREAAPTAAVGSVAPENYEVEE